MPRAPGTSWELRKHPVQKRHIRSIHLKVFGTACCGAEPSASELVRPARRPGRNAETAEKPIAASPIEPSVTGHPTEDRVGALNADRRGRSPNVSGFRLPKSYRPLPVGGIRIIHCHNVNHRTGNYFLLRMMR